ncbi:glycosyltransferase involved in cell wall biosynthesis [Ereboglobus sp. PH5-5]|uniref:glycosyltransferase n=1 Tax=Ereboglobus sp. PH5-5 TaxID=2940529 RepID=UPI002404D821|nr:glycosyltransferase [Ereboglobus sp. PH5-5]MDF9833209.1 glycosyltransferase involved in cell wall biosynthesis [Ereboglobus sp. PH5-5]
MKKIVILQDYLRNGGTERQSVHLAGRFAAHGLDTTLLTFRPGGALAPPSAQSQISTGQQQHSANYKFQSLQSFDTHLDFFAPRLIPALRRLAPDIVLCMGRMANCKAGRIARALPDAAVISTMRTGKKLPRAYIRSLHTTSHVIANSHAIAKTLVENYDVPDEKISVIHNAIVHDADSAPQPEESTDAVPSSALQPFSPSALPHRLLCVAMLRPEKNHHELIKIFSQLPPAPPAELHIIGAGSELLPCCSAVKRMGLVGRVHFHGYLSDPSPYYKQARVAVLTSHSESLPNFLVEAHMHGIPSVAYAVGGVSECGGIAITPGNQPAFIAALTRLLNDPEHHAAESARVAAHAQEHFAPQTQLRRYLEIFAKVTA